MPQQLTNDGMAPIHTSPRVGLWARRYGWLAYWFVFAAYTLYAARNPAFVLDPKTAAPYPWVAALVTCALLGAQTAALNAMLRPLSGTRSWQRVAAATGLAVVFAALTLITTVTDMPGYYYAPGLFAAANMFVVPIVGAVLALRPTRAAAEACSSDAAAQRVVAPDERSELSM